MFKKVILVSILVTGFIACTSQETTRDMINRADKLVQQQEYEQAIDIYETVLATRELSDSLDAMVNFALADIYLNYKNQYRQAVKYYRVVAEKYSATQWGPKSQFLLGYVNANHLRNFDIAETEYQKFLDIYPTHELTSAVQFEVNHLGDNSESLDSLKFLQSAAQQ